MFFEFVFALWIIGGMIAYGLTDTISGPKERIGFGLKVLAFFESWIVVGAIIGIALHEIGSDLENKKFQS